MSAFPCFALTLFLETLFMVTTPTRRARRDDALAEALRELGRAARRVGQLLARRREPRAAAGGIRRVVWPGAGHFWLSEAQRRVVSVLLDAYLHGAEPDVPEEVLLDASGGTASSAADLFARGGAWGTLVVPGGRPGAFRLPEVPERD